MISCVRQFQQYAWWNTAWPYIATICLCCEYLFGTYSAFYHVTSNACKWSCLSVFPYISYIFLSRFEHNEFRTSKVSWHIINRIVVFWRRSKEINVEKRWDWTCWIVRDLKKINTRNGFFFRNGEHYLMAQLVKTMILVCLFRRLKFDLFHWMLQPR